MSQKEYKQSVKNLIDHFTFLESLMTGPKEDLSIPDIENMVAQITKLMTIYHRRKKEGILDIKGKDTFKICEDWIEFGKTQPAQGTEEWLAQRVDLLSASDVGSALGENPYKDPEIVIIDKCGHPDRWWFGDMSNIFCHHGHKYEYVAAQIHEVNNPGVQCFEASFIPHPKIKFIGASPDKFVLDYNTYRGYLVEIKCPYRRYPKIGIVPRYYWVQMQIQMEVTDLDECYFEDCRIMEYSEDQFLEDEESLLKGVIGAVQDLVNETTSYIYPRLKIDKPETFEEKYARMKKEIMDEVNRLQSVSERYYFSPSKGFCWWRLTMHQSILVLRDRAWFKEAYPKLKKFWELVEYHRKHGYNDLLEKYGKAPTDPPVKN